MGAGPGSELGRICRDLGCHPGSFMAEDSLHIYGGRDPHCPHFSRRMKEANMQKEGHHGDVKCV